MPPIVRPGAVLRARPAVAAGWAVRRDIFPALLSHFDEAWWNVLGYNYSPGRRADYSPGSPDLDRLVRLMNAINVPDEPGPFSELKTARSRTFITWKRPRSSPGRSWPIRTGPRQRADIGAPRLADRLGLAHPRRRLERPGLLGTPRPHGIRRRPGPLHKARPRARPLVNLAFGIDKMNEMDQGGGVSAACRFPGSSRHDG